MWGVSLSIVDIRIGLLAVSFSFQSFGTSFIAWQDIALETCKSSFQWHTTNFFMSYICCHYFLPSLIVKNIFKWNPLTKRSQGTPKYRWEDNVKQDICQMKVKNWITCIQDRGKWKDVVEKAITLHPLVVFMLIQRRWARCGRNFIGVIITTLSHVHKWNLIQTIWTEKYCGCSTYPANMENMVSL